MRVLVVGDLHFPFARWDLIHELYAFATVYKPDVIVQLGDLIDGKAWSKYGKDPNDLGADQEWDAAETDIHKFYKLFKGYKLVFLEGNHCRRIMFRAAEAGLPSRLIPRLHKIFPFKGVIWHMDNTPFEIDGVMYSHGDELIGGGNVKQRAMSQGKSFVQGHTHTAELHFISTFNHRIFGAIAGCLVDMRSLGMKYAARNLNRCFLGWMTVTDGRCPTIYSADDWRTAWQEKD